MAHRRNAVLNKPEAARAGMIGLWGNRGGLRSSRVIQHPATAPLTCDGGGSFPWIATATDAGIEPRQAVDSGQDGPWVSGRCEDDIHAAVTGGARGWAVRGRRRRSPPQ